MIKLESKPQRPATIDAYIADFPQEIQAILEEIRNIIKHAAPEAKEKISYQMPTFTLNGNLLHFAAYKNHIGLYPLPSGVEEFKEELAAYKTSTGSIQFPLDQPIPYDLIRRIAIFRVEENETRAAKKQKK